MRDRQQLGQAGEDAAARHLARQGMQVIARNWRCRYGEIDIIARDGSVLVFCEVKTRRGIGFGAPLAAVTPRKVARIRRLIALWLVETGGHRGPVRLDAVGLLQHPDGHLDIEHVRGVS